MEESEKEAQKSSNVKYFSKSSRAEYRFIKIRDITIMVSCGLETGGKHDKLMAIFLAKSH